MKKLLLLICLFISVEALAQNQDELKKIEAARIGLISERLGLTPAQAEKFWPLYNEYVEKRKEFRQELSKARENLDLNKASEEEKRRLIDLGHKLKERELALERDYSERLLKVVSSQQLLNLKKAEDDFREMLLQRLQQQRSQNRAEEQRGKQQERMDNRRRSN